MHIHVFKGYVFLVFKKRMFYENLLFIVSYAFGNREREREKQRERGELLESQRERGRKTDKIKELCRDTTRWFLFAGQMSQRRTHDIRKMFQHGLRRELKMHEMRHFWLHRD